jgi:XTP/dITP diphosphohydrolase
MDTGFMNLVVGTNNEGKLRELRALLSGRFASVRSLREAGIVCDPAENGATFLENAVIKCREIARRAAGYAVLADDSGLCADALGGAPGVHSARWAGADGADKDAKNNEKLLQLLKQEENRAAAFVACVALLLPDGTLVHGDGRTEGVILREPVGRDGFGYDPYFYSPALGTTFAAAPADKKNAVSHRAAAVKDLLKKLS